MLTKGADTTNLAPDELTSTVADKCVVLLLARTFEILQDKLIPLRPFEE